MVPPGLRFTGVVDGRDLGPHTVESPPGLGLFGSRRVLSEQLCGMLMIGGSESVLREATRALSWSRAAPGSSVGLGGGGGGDNDGEHASRAEFKSVAGSMFTP